MTFSWSHADELGRMAERVIEEAELAGKSWPDELDSALEALGWETTREHDNCIAMDPVQDVVAVLRRPGSREWLELWGVSPEGGRLSWHECHRKT